MKHSRRQHLALMTAALGTPFVTPMRLLAQAGTHDIEMLNADPEDRRRAMVFSPAVLRVQPGDTVRFVATDRGHNARSIDGMTPDGADPFRGRINEAFEVSLAVEGTYGYLCQPHQTMGMIGLILVGDFTANLDAVRAAGENLRGRASSERFAEYLAETEAIAAAEGLT